MAESIRAYFEIVTLLEKNGIWKNTVMNGEPQLGRRGFFRTLGAQIDSEECDKAMWWVLNLSDGEHDVIDIAQRSNISWKVILDMVERLQEGDLLRKVG